jgi:hypothetical protein
MKWGVRKGSSSSSSGHAPSEDHLTAEAHRAKIKSGGVKALSNHELTQLVDRMNLEQRHRDLAEKRPSKFTRIETGDAHVRKALKITKTMADVYNTVNSPAGKAARKVATKLVK